MRAVSPWFAAVAALLVAGPALAHSRLTDPTPLTPDDNAKSGPCGCYFGAPETPGEDASPLQCPGMFETTTYQAGAQVQIAWEETINHSGSFRIAFSPKSVQDVTKADLEEGVLLDIPDDIAGGPLVKTITIPSTPCESCTLQLRQFMAGAASPYYYSCASIKVVGDEPMTGSSSASSGSGGAASGAGGGPSGLGGAGGADQGGTKTSGAGVATPPPETNLGCSFSAIPHENNGERSGSSAALLVGIGAIAAGFATRRRKGRA